MEKLYAELEDIKSSKLCIEEAIEYVKKYKDDCEADIELLQDVIKSFESISDNVRNEIDELEQEQQKENQKELNAMNCEFERSRL
jgi:prefoldin subunit 5